MAKIDPKELAESYGFAYSFLQHEPSLKKLFAEAVKGNWDAARFTAAIKGSSFYKNNADTVRNYDLLVNSDHATYLNKRSALAAQIRDRAAQLGASVSGATLNRIADNAMKFGWNDSQIQDTLGSYVKVMNGIYRGSTGDALDAVRQTAYKNGISLSKATQQSWAQQLANGNQTASNYQRQIRNMAKSLAPSYSKELDAGVDLQDIVSPFIESKAKLLELNPADIDMFDKDIRKAVSGTTKDGQPSSTSLWQFEQSIREQPAWLKTQNAQDSVMGTAKKVLTDFGFQGVT